MKSANVLLFSLFSVGHFDPTLLHCSCQDDRFSSRIAFVYANNGALVGELDNFVLKPGQDPRFISGDVFFDISSKDGLIQGHTGDPRGIIDSFTLTRRSKQNTGTWVYKKMENSGSRSTAIFKCEYDEDLR